MAVICVRYNLGIMNESKVGVGLYTRYMDGLYARYCR